jgi:hypothetical protein
MAGSEELLSTRVNNPWHVESINDFSFFCCPECVYRSKADIDFEAHAIKTHPKVVKSRQT